MPTEYIIGSAPNSRIKVPADRKGVSGRHLKITVGDDGTMTAEDLQSANGTYLRDANGEFHRIYKKQISEADILRLGPGGANSYTFMARRVADPDASYQYEFRHLKSTLRRFREEEKKKEAKMEINQWLSKLSGLAAVAVCTILTAIGIIEIDPNIRYIVIAMAPVLVGLLFSGQAKALRNLRNRRQKVMLCPSCGKPISEFDIEEGQCSRCKAK